MEAPLTDTFTTRSCGALVTAITRLSRRVSFWTIALPFHLVTAFPTAPRSRYGLYEHHEHRSSLPITFACAASAVGVVAGLVLAGHVSELGRRTRGNAASDCRRPCGGRAELAELVGLIEQYPDLNVVVLDSVNPEFYLVHYDVENDPSRTAALGVRPTGMPGWIDFLVRLSRAPVVTIASIRGRARGAGSEFVLACDLRFASRENTLLAQFEVGIGGPRGRSHGQALPLGWSRPRARDPPRRRRSRRTSRGGVRGTSTD